MGKEITKLEPAEVWKNFYMLTQVPRPSYHEERARKVVMDWAKENKVDAKIDAAGNIHMTKPATKGMEKCKGVILQGHLDMVPQKNEDVKHNFETDPINTVIDGDWVKAKGTTLGADNGIGVATALSIIASNKIQHGPLEVLITATEETGMDGANGLQKNVLKGDILLNLDSETEGELYVGCAGGIDTSIEFDYESDSVPAGCNFYRLAVKGLRGGHSGMDINLGRGNSNKLLFRFLKTYADQLGIRISFVNGGTLRNAIPRESFAVIAVPASNDAAFKKALKEATATYKAELIEKDPDVKVSAEKADQPLNVMTKCLQSRLTNSILACPNGAIRMVDSMPDTVETSNNLAIVKTEDGKIMVKTLLRSSVESAKMAHAQTLVSVFELAKATKIELSGAYPGWKPNPNSAIRKEMMDIYKKIFKKEPRVMAIHAGLECGLIGAKYPKMDMVSFGPTIEHPHSPDERVNIESVQKFWKFICEVLKNIPNK